MKLHTVFVTYNRQHLSKQTIESYLETVTMPYTFTVVDNASSDGSQEWIMQLTYGGLITRHLLDKNCYPGYATNLGWSDAPKDATHLQRADNDFRFLPNWCEEVKRAFASDALLGQLGLRTDEEEMYVESNVGGNCIIMRKLWDAGLRYDETPWTEYPPGFSEDSYFSPAVREMGYQWKRVQRPCIRSLATGDWNDPYYAKSYGDRRIVPNLADPLAPGTR